MAERCRLLSYVITVDTYAYGGKRPFALKPGKRISKGDACNTSILELPNHFGTHIDCPNHFFDAGKKICQYKAGDFIFLKPFLLECPKSANEVISEADIKRNYSALRKADLLLLRTGFYKHRGKYRYSTENPGVAPDAALFIRERLINIRCVGIDTISVSPYRNRELGRATHRVFFKSGFKGKPLCLIEDMDLSGKLGNLEKVQAFPLLVKDIDSSPCTVIGFLGKG